MKKIETKGKNLEDIQEMNRSLVIRMLHRMNVCSRAKLAAETGLKQATITNIVGDLINWGLVHETGIIDGERGRRSIGISLNKTAYKVIGLRLTRKYISIGLFDIGGAIYDTKEIEIDTTSGSSKALRKMKDLVGEMLKSADDGRVMGIGMGIPGPFLRQEGRIILMTEFPGWEHLDITKELQSSFGLPVYIEHDANCAVLAEWWYRPNPKDDGTMIYIAAGQGIGAGILIDGKIYRGSLGTAGEIGHMSIDYKGMRCECGNYGCLEKYCSSIALAHCVDSLRDSYPNSILSGNSVSEVAKAAERKDPLALEAVKRISMFLGVGITNLISNYNPDIIVIGDEIATLGDLLLKEVCENVKSRILNEIFKELKIELCSFDSDPVLVGASALAFNHILTNPSSFMKLDIDA